MSPELAPEDAKLITLARAAARRVHADSGAAVRDLDGRTYVAADIDLPSLSVRALDLAVAMAISSGAKGLEAAAVVARDTATEYSVDAMRDLAGRQVPVFVADTSGTLTQVRST